MTDTKYIDFADVKSRCSVEQAMSLLGLKLKRSSNQFRGSCPVHGGGERTLVVTPERGFYCFAERKGGDQISLVAHVREMPVREAAVWMLDRIGGQHQITPRRQAVKSANPGDQLKPLDYLDYQHEALELLGVSPAAAEAIGIGYAPKGTMSGRIAIPLRLEDGTLVGYCGIATREDLIPLISFPKNLEERCGVTEANQEPDEPVEKKPADLRKHLRVVA